MKKLILPLLIIGVLFSSCKNEPDDPGTVKLDITNKDTKFGDVYTIKPIFSTTGEVLKKSYSWSSDKDSIASVTLIDGGYGQVKAKRIGDAIITYASSDGKINLKSTVKVVPQSTILNGIKYQKGATESDIAGFMPFGFTKSSNSTASFLVYSNSSSTSVTDLIYEMKNGVLEAMYIIVKNTTDNQRNVKQYLDERFNYTTKTTPGITYYLNTGIQDYLPIGTMLGIFYDISLNGSTYEYGVKVIDKSLVP